MKEARDFVWELWPFLVGGSIGFFVGYVVAYVQRQADQHSAYRQEGDK